MLSKIASRLIRFAAPLVVIAMLFVSSVARADSVDTLIKQLSDSSDKVRLAAALNIAKAGDERGILPLAKTLLNDSDKNVRGAAAVGLGKLIKSNPNTKYKSLATANLKTAAANDASDFVKTQASNALITIGSGGGSTTTQPSGGGGIYVNVGPMSSKTTSSKNDKLRALMVKTAQKTLTKVASNMSQTWPSGTPSKADLAKKGVSGFYVDGTLNTLDIKTSGGGATISCKVSMLLADFPDKSVFGFLNGGASVTASSSKTDQDLASEDCVTAVIENLITSKIVPTIKSKVP
ncbi:MAG TPA: HEAT repeat domain-containing protein [Kofleriaceae bacterium]|nr:HEAT repeat domain-containing protein [Kofleriaceae bacterium]